MAFNGSGVFNRLYNWVQDASNNIQIMASRMDNETQGIADGLTNCITRDGQSPPTADIPMGGKKITGLADPVNPQDAVSKNFLSSSNVPFLQSGTGAVTSTLQTKNRLRLDAADFGVVGDGVTTDTAALQLAVNEAVARNATLYLPSAIKTGAITISGPCAIVGAGGKTIITAVSGSYDMFTISASDVTIENIYILDAAKSGGWDFKIACGTTARERITIRNINTLNSFGAITDSGSGSGTHTTTRITEYQARSHNGPGISMTRLFAFGFITQVAIDYVGVSASNYTAFFFNLSGLGAGAGGVVFRDCDVLGTSGTFTNANQRGYDIRNTAAIWMTDCRADTCDEIGFNFDTVNFLHLSGPIASLCNGHGISLTSVTSGTFINPQVYGRNGLSSPAASIDGIRLVSGCAAINSTGGLVRECTGNGLNKVAAQAGAVKFGDISAFNNTGRAIKSVGNSAFLVTGGQFGGNVAGNYDLGGSSDFIQVSQLNSGTIANVGPGPVTG